MKNVLFVDDDQGFLLSLIDMINDAETKEPFGIITAYNGRDAMEVLKKQPIDLVVTDIKMPEVDGFDLVAHMSREHYAVPVIVMTAYGTPEMENRLMDMGAFQYIEKPIDFNTLLKKISEGLHSGSKGFIVGISLPAFIQLIQLEKKTCTLTVESAGKTGKLFFQHGELTNAFTGDLAGQEAAMEICCWEQTKIEILSICKDRKRLINVPLGYILIESARLSDEKKEKQEVKKGKTPAGQDDKLVDSEIDSLDFDIRPPAMPGAEKESADADILSESSEAEIPEIGQLFDVLQSAEGVAKPEAIPKKAVQKGEADKRIPGILKHFQDNLIRVIGPIGKLIMAEVQEKWETEGSPSQERLVGLTDMLCEEINNKKLESTFREKVERYLK